MFLSCRLAQNAIGFFHVRLLKAPCRHGWPPLQQFWFWCSFVQRRTKHRNFANRVNHMLLKDAFSSNQLPSCGVGQQGTDASSSDEESGKEAAHELLEPCPKRQKKDSDEDAGDEGIAGGPETSPLACSTLCMGNKLLVNLSLPLRCLCCSKRLHWVGNLLAR